jgi:hypothetical protein
MKQQFIILLSIAILYSCNNENGSRPPKEIKRDTSNTVVAVLGYKKQGWIPLLGRRIVVDSLKWEGDSMNQKRKWGKATYYLVNLPVQVDSTIAQKFNVPLLDSNGKPYTVTIPDVPYVYPYVRDTIYDLKIISQHFKPMIQEKTGQ